jgi:AhpC/TSA family.
MKYVKWLFVVLLITSLTSFVGKDKPTGGLNIGDVAPDFSFRTTLKNHQLNLKDLKGQYVLINFWASYDAQSRMQNVSLNNAIRDSFKKVKFVSISFDEYQSVFKETVRKDQIASLVCFVDTKGETSEIFKEYSLDRGFSSYLLDENGVIIAKNISAPELSSFIN